LDLIFKREKKPKLPVIPSLIKIKRWDFLRKYGWILLLLLLFFIGFLFFRTSDAKKEKRIQESLSQIIRLTEEAEALMSSGQESRAASGFKSAFEKVSAFAEKENLVSEILPLKERIERGLMAANKIQAVENPVPVAALTDFAPEKVAFSDPYIYAYRPGSSEIRRIKAKDASTSSFDAPEPVWAVSDSSGFLLAASKKNLHYPEVDAWKTSNLALPENQILSSYLMNLYLLDLKDCRIEKLAYSGQFVWKNPEIWKDPEQTCRAKSISIDGSVWILNKDNSVLRYYTGIFEEKFSFDIYPETVELTKIIAGRQSPYLFLLEPANKRLIIADKNGKILKQIQSKRFENLKDFTLSEDEKTAFVLAGSEIFRLPL